MRCMDGTLFEPCMHAAYSILERTPTILSLLHCTEREVFNAQKETLIGHAYMRFDVLTRWVDAAAVFAERTVGVRASMLARAITWF